MYVGHEVRMRCEEDLSRIWQSPGAMGHARGRTADPHYTLVCDARSRSMELPQAAVNEMAVISPVLEPHVSSGQHHPWYFSPGSRCSIWTSRSDSDSSAPSTTSPSLLSTPCSPSRKSGTGNIVTVWFAGQAAFQRAQKLVLDASCERRVVCGAGCVCKTVVCGACCVCKTVVCGAGCVTTSAETVVCGAGCVYRDCGLWCRLCLQRLWFVVQVVSVRLWFVVQVV